MAKKSTPSAVPATPETSLTPKQINQAFTNDPRLAEDEFKLGDRTFKIVDLEYDDYLIFMTMLEPLLQTFVGAIGARQGVSLPGLNLSAGSFNLTSLVKYCGESLPEMVCIICKGTDPLITASDVKKLGKNPLRLAEIVIKQVVRNGIIKDISSFFGQILLLMKQEA